MSILKKISLAVATIAVVSTSSFAGQVLVGGNVPLINNVTGIGVLTLDVSSAATNPVNIATFIVNNNSTTFDVSWVLTNGGHFANGTRNIPMATIALVGGAGTLGAGNDAVTEAVIATAAFGTPTAAAHWNTTQTSATENYVVLMNATWLAATRPLAGLYTEQVVFTITATM